MNWNAIAILILALFLGGPARAAQADDANMVETYSSASMGLDVLDQTLRAVAGKDAQIVVDRQHQRCIVIADPEAHRRIAVVMKDNDTPPENVQVEVRIRRATDSSETGAVVTGDAGSRSRIRVSPSVQHRSTRTQSDATQTLLVASGRSGMLRVAQTVPHLGYFETFGWRARSVDYRVVWQEVGSFLRVQPTILDGGPQILLELTPVLSGRVDGRPHEIEFAEAATEVVVNEGQTISLASLEEHQDFMSKFLVGMERARETYALDVELTSRRVGADGSGDDPMVGAFRRTR